MAITKEFAKSVVESMANYLKIPHCGITFLKMECEYKNMPGFYVDGAYIINVNTLVVNNFTDLEFTSFLIHEMRHAYQHVLVKNNLTRHEKKSVIKVWKEEIENYVNPVLNKEEYLIQSIEIDAVAFTAYFTKKYLNQDLIIPEIIQNKVLNRIKEIELYYN